MFSFLASEVAKSARYYELDPKYKEEDLPAPEAEPPTVNSMHALAMSWNSNTGLQNFQKLYSGFFRFARNNYLIDKTDRHPPSAVEPAHVFASRFGEISVDVFCAWREAVKAMNIKDISACDVFKKKFIADIVKESSTAFQPRDTLKSLRSKITDLETSHEEIINRYERNIADLEKEKEECLAALAGARWQP